MRGLHRGSATTLPSMVLWPGYLAIAPLFGKIFWLLRSFFHCKIVGMPYLSETLKPVLDKIFEERKYCELDPCKAAERKQSALRWGIQVGHLNQSSLTNKSLWKLRPHKQTISEGIVETRDYQNMWLKGRIYLPRSRYQLFALSAIQVLLLE